MSFDLDSFLDTPTSGALETRFKPMPAGDYEAIVEEMSQPEMRSFKDKQTGETVSKPAFTVTYRVLDDDVVEAMKPGNPTIRQNIWLNVNDAGALDMEQNLPLGRLMEAAGVDMEKKWTPRDAQSATVMVRVAHSEYQGETYANVTRVAAPVAV